MLFPLMKFLLCLQFSQIEKLLINRLLRPEHLINALSQYVIEQFNLNTIQLNDVDFQGVNIMTLPNIPVKSRILGEFLINKFDFQQYLEDILKTKGKK
ncbi:unnamed protein product [Adineta steineri]|uniref:Uncharacterized protein n=1 Tax=Adineta steineri TaxID=433720 RepID=A0A818ZKJ0_9BILA|nr:unnamed protein product [Adineta steineri]CAF1359892.1 unnamed protein product [Adineta steineri]CAF1398631.1 unnamed protein product [Adineta steineri]CAF3766255.1 unnamed protein product [Adineta steineri]CAF3864338.1 unnamed protein product [Adineta steineri]